MCIAGAPGEQAAGGGAVRGGQPGVARRGGRGGAAGAPGRPRRAARAQTAARKARRRSSARQVRYIIILLCFLWPVFAT